MDDNSSLKAVDSFSQHIGDRIRYFRQQRDMSLSELARQSGIAKGTLSQLESGKGNPTVLTLSALAGILGLTPGDFMETKSSPTEVAVRGSRDIDGPVIKLTFIHRIIAGATWDLYEGIIPDIGGPIHSKTHAGLEHILILEGSAIIGPSDAPVTLKQGEHTVFNGRLPHLYLPLEHPCKVLLFMEHHTATPVQRNTDIST